MGISASQGPHQVAQKFSTTIFPRRSANFAFAPYISLSVSEAGFSPAAPPGTVSAAQNTNPPSPVIHRFSILSPKPHTIPRTQQFRQLHRRSQQDQIPLFL